jgi:hypothetical protein
MARYAKKVLGKKVIPNIQMLKLSLFLLTLFSLGLITACGGGGGGSGTGSGGGSTPSVNGTMSGTAIKGPVSNATVTAFSINNGTMGRQLGTGQTDAQGNFSISIGDYSGPVLLQMVDGDYMDEATGSMMSMQPTDVMTAAIPFMTAGSTMSGIQITPLTSMAQSMAQGMSGSMTQTNITTANNAMGQYFDVSDLLHTTPMNPDVNNSGAGANQDMKNYGMTIASICQYAKDIGIPNSSTIVTAMMDDASDGHMNGMMGNTQIQMGGGMMGGGMMAGGMMMSSNAGTSGLATAMSEFIQSTMNKSGVTVQDMQTLINKLQTSNGLIQ